jgi:hypothetical protein
MRPTEVRRRTRCVSKRRTLHLRLVYSDAVIFDVRLRAQIGHPADYRSKVRQLATVRNTPIHSLSLKNAGHAGSAASGFLVKYRLCDPTCRQFAADA